MKRNRKSGFTVVELLIVFVIVAIGIAVLGSMFNGCGVFADEQRSNATEEARTWISEMFPEVPADQIHVVCQGTDTDGNGYVSCSARVGEERLNLECYSYVVANYGDNTCRETTVLQGPGTRRR